MLLRFQRVTLFSLALCLWVPMPLVAQQAELDSKQEEQAKFRKNLEAKLEKKFVKSGGWILDYQTARERAASEDKLLFVYFTRTFAP